MPASKIVDEAEVRSWIADGKTYAWMREEYLRKYQLQVSATMFSNFRQRRGLDRRIAGDEALIPWHVARTHRHAYAVGLLRLEARDRAGLPLTAAAKTKLAGFKRSLTASDLVVGYDPEVGFTYVARRAGIDTDLIREPEKKTRARAGAEQSC